MKNGKRKLPILLLGTNFNPINFQGGGGQQKRRAQTRHEPSQVGASLGNQCRRAFLSDTRQTEVRSFPFNYALTPGEVLPYKRLMGMCRWMGSYFHGWIDCNGVAFSMALLEWGRTFSDFGGKKNSSHLRLARLVNVPECLYCR